MTLFAFTLQPSVRTALLSVVQGLFLLFVVGSFIGVAVYVTRRFCEGRLIPSGHEPLPLNMPHMAGWFFVISVLLLVLVGEPGLYALLVVMGVVGVLVENGRNFSQQFGFTRLKPLRTVTWALLGFGAVMLVETPLSQASMVALDAFHISHPEQQTVVTFRQFNQAPLILAFLFQAVFLFPIIEEFFFRGFLITFLKNYTSAWMAIALSATLFAAVHLNIGAFLPLWFLGFALGLAYEHTGSLLVPIGMHMCFNLATGLYLLLDKGSA